MKIKTWQYITIGLLSLLAVLLIALDAWMAPYDLAKEHAAARAAGLPLTEADLHRLKPPASRDAGPDWLALSTLLEKCDIDDSAIAKHNNPLPPSAIADIRRLMAERQDAVSLIRRATDKPEAYFEHGWSNFEIFKYFGPMRRAARMLRWEALMLFREGRIEEAVEVQSRGFRVADHAGMDPLIISYLVSIAVEAITMAGFEDILLEAGPDPRVTGLVRRAINANPSRRNLRFTMRGEALFGVSGIREIRSISDVRTMLNPATMTGSPSPARANPLVVHYVTQQGEAAHLRWMARVIQAKSLPTYAERRAAVARVTQELESKGSLRPPAEMLAALTVPVFSKVEDRDIAALAKRRVLLAACDVLDYRARTGTWPGRIEDAERMPQVDPFNDRPVSYRREGSGFVLYSVGEDGKYAAKPGQPYRGQAVFRYPATGNGTKTTAAQP